MILFLNLETLNIDKKDIISSKKSNDIAFPRQIAMYLAKKHTEISASKIGMLIGNRDHATVLHACKTVKDLIEINKSFKSDIEEIEAALKRK